MPQFSKTLILPLVAVVAASVLSCGKNADDASSVGRAGSITVDVNDENAQQIGEVMASIDEAGGATGSLAIASVGSRASCAGYGFGSCTANTVNRVFNGCSIGLSTLSGTVGLTWTGSSVNCTLGAAGDSIQRSPNFTMTGPRGGTLAVTKAGALGQALTWTGGTGASKTFDFTSDGINRRITHSGVTYYDVTTRTTSAIAVSGTSRSGRVMSGGTLRLTNNVTAATCDVSPSNVTWEMGCNCATNGSWSGNCGGQTFAIEITGCGTGTLTAGTSSQSVAFDRCLAN
ncbi:MAG: hypothetical protein IPJ84_08065 [Bdellovibrionales bacterium]|nr:hypothetical protein [Bdellovibrionales bacterium]